MAQLLLITVSSMADDGRQIGDVVGIYDDAHRFSEHEQKIFEIVKAEGTQAEWEGKRPDTDLAWKSETTEWTRDLPVQARVWRDDRGWNEVKELPRFLVRYENGALVGNYSRLEVNRTQLIAVEESVSRD